MTAQPGSASRRRRIRGASPGRFARALVGRAPRRQRRGIAFSPAGYGIATFSAWLGDHLSFGKGVGVNQTAFEAGPGDWTPVLDEATPEERKLTGARTDGVAVLLVRKGARVFALADRCSHRGCALHEGKLNDDDTVTCRCQHLPPGWKHRRGASDAPASVLRDAHEGRQDRDPGARPPPPGDAAVLPTRRPPQVTRRQGPARQRGAHNGGSAQSRRDPDGPEHAGDERS